MPKKQTRNTVTKSFTFEPALAEFIDKRSELFSSASQYMSELVKHDRSENTIADIAKKTADRLAAA